MIGEIAAPDEDPRVPARDCCKVGPAELCEWTARGCLALSANAIPRGSDCTVDNVPIVSATSGETLPSSGQRIGSPTCVNSPYAHATLTSTLNTAKSRRTDSSSLSY